MVKVPCSDSNLSNRGVKAKIFITAWKKPAWTRGKVFVRYTGEHNRIRYKSSGEEEQDYCNKRDTHWCSNQSHPG